MHVRCAYKIKRLCGSQIVHSTGITSQESWEGGGTELCLGHWFSEALLNFVVTCPICPCMYMYMTHSRTCCRMYYSKKGIRFKMYRFSLKSILIYVSLYYFDQKVDGDGLKSVSCFKMWYNSLYMYMYVHVCAKMQTNYSRMLYMISENVFIWPNSANTWMHIIIMLIRMST